MAEREADIRALLLEIRADQRALRADVARLLGRLDVLRQRAEIVRQARRERREKQESVTRGARYLESLERAPAGAIPLRGKSRA